MTSQTAKLHRLLSQRLNRDEIRILCYNLHIDYDDLPGEGKSAKSSELVAHLQRRKQLDDLVTYLEKNRPDLRQELQSIQIALIGADEQGIPQLRKPSSRVTLAIFAAIMIGLLIVFIILTLPSTGPVTLPLTTEPSLTESSFPNSTVTFGVPLSLSPTPIPSSSRSPTVSATSQPTVTPTFILPTPTPVPEPTPTPTVTTQPAPILNCLAAVEPFTEIWVTTQDTIGCASSSLVTGLIAEESFYGGKMFWREPFDYSQAVIMFSDGTWQIFQHQPYDDTQESEFSCLDENTPAQCPPTPKRGFGMMWCDIPTIRGRLGNAIECERGYQGAMQQFEQGFMLQSDSGSIYIFYGYESGRWERR